MSAPTCWPEIQPIMHFVNAEGKTLTIQELKAGKKGTERTRPAVCDCGKEYTQSQLHPAWMARMAEYAPTLATTFPDGWTPDFCPKCARQANNLTARADDRRLSTDGRMDVEPLHRGPRQDAVSGNGDRRDRRWTDRRALAGSYGERE